MKDSVIIVAAILIVVVKTNIQEKEIRFDITYSEKAQKYSMYISLPTSSRSISLSKNVYENQYEVINEIEKWLIYAKCKKNGRPKKIMNSDNKFEQLSLI